MSSYVIGLDFGTLSGRAVLVDVETGEVLMQKAKDYRCGVIEGALPSGKQLPESFALAEPGAYTEVLDHIVTGLVEMACRAGIDPKDIIAIGLDVTCSTFVPVNGDGIPLCETPEFADEPQAWMKLWKHHGAQVQADRLTALMRERNEDFAGRCGNKINAEWMMPKLLEILEEAPAVYDAAANFEEAGDYLIRHMTGETVRSYTMLGYKMVTDPTAASPSRDFFAAADPRFADVRSKLLGKLLMPGERAGHLTKKCAEKYGLRPGIPVAAANIDAHVAFPALGITKPHSMLLILGTSCCMISIDEREAPVPGVFGIVRDGVLSGFYGYEAGQSAVGDLFEWFTSHMVPEDYRREAEARGMDLHQYLTALSKKIRPGESGLLALDWWNGNRSVLSDTALTGMLLGLTLKTKPEEIYRALIESVAFGVREIIETYAGAGIETRELYACGGIVKKNRMLLQIYADVTNLPIRVGRSDQCSALGSAIYAAVAAGREAGGYSDVFDAAEKMGHTEDTCVMPIPENAAVYEYLYREYHRLHDYFGRGENDVMKRLLMVKEGALERTQKK